MNHEKPPRSRCSCGSYAVIFLTVVENAAEYVLVHRGRTAVANRIDRVSLFVFPLAFLAFLGALGAVRAGVTNVDFHRKDADIAVLGFGEIGVHLLRARRQLAAAHALAQ